MKAQDEDRCELYEKRGSRHTRCTHPREMQYDVDHHTLVICFKHWGYEPAQLDEICRFTIKHKPKEEPSEEGS